MPASPQLTPVVQALLVLARRGREVRAQQTAVSVVPLTGDAETAAGAGLPAADRGAFIISPDLHLSTGKRG